MTKDTKLTEDLRQFEDLEKKDEELIQKLNEFLVLLDKSELNTENIKKIQSGINGLIDHKLNSGAIVKEIKQVSEGILDKMEQLDKLEILLKSLLKTGLQNS